MSHIKIINGDLMLCDCRGCVPLPTSDVGSCNVTENKTRADLQQWVSSIVFGEPEMGDGDAPESRALHDISTYFESRWEH